MANARRYRTEFVITGDSRSAVKANNDATESTERLTKEMALAERQSEATSQGLMEIGSRATAMAAAVGLSVTGIATMTAQTAAAVRDQVTLANAVGVNVQTLQSWGYAARQVGLDSEKMGDIFKDTADKIGDFVRTGGGGAADLLEQLNLNIGELQSMSPDQQLLAIGRALDDVQNHGERVFFAESIASDLSRLLPLLDNNAEKLREYAQQARDLRIVLPQEDIDRLDEAGQSIQYLQEAGRGLAQTVAADLAPTIDDMADNVEWLIDRLGGMEGVVDKGTVALELMASVAAGKALVGIGNLGSRVEQYITTQQNQIKTQNTAIETERRASVEALRLAQSRQASAKQMLANSQATAAATGITTNRTKAITLLAAANVELTSAERRHTAAMAASTTTATGYAVAMRGVGTAARWTLGALGGWPGLLIAGASAAVMLSDSSDDLSDSLDSVGESLMSLDTPLDNAIEKFGQLSRDQQASALANWGDKQKEQAEIAANALSRIRSQATDMSGGVNRRTAFGSSQLAELNQFITQLNEAAKTGESLYAVIERNAEALGVPEDTLQDWAKLAGVYDTASQKAENYGERMGAVIESQAETGTSADDAAGGITRVGDALGTSADKWDDYLGKLESARDTLGMTAAEAAEYAANQAGYTGLYAEQSGAIAGQTDALKGYQTAIEQGDQVAADAHLATAQRFAEQEAMVQAQLANLGTLSGLLQGVQSDLSATALSAALVVGDGASNTTELVEQALATIEARAAAIRGTTEFGSKATDEAKALNKELADAEKTYDNLRESFDPLGTAADEYAKKQSALNLLQQQGKKTAEEIAQAQFELTQQYRDSIDPLQGILDRMDPGAALLREYREDVENLRTAADAAGRSQLEITAGIAQLAAEYAKAEKEADPYYQRTLELRQEYDSSALKARQLQKDLADLNQRYRDGKIGPEEYQRSVASVRDEMRQLARDSDPAAQEMARAWEEAADRIDETFADAFAGAFDSFDDFSDQLLDGFKRLLAELAYQATLKPIVVDFTSSVGNALGIPGVGGGVGGTSGSGGIGSLASLGKNLYNSVTNGFGNVSWTGVGGSAGGLYSNVATGSGGLYNNIASGGLSSGGLWGGSTGNFTGMTGLGSLGAGLAGSYVGTELGSSVFGKNANSNYGAMAGSAIGTYFGGPLGALAGGALGGALDSAFGSSRDYKAGFVQTAETPDRDFGAGGTPYYSSGYYRDGDLGRGRESAFGSFGFTKKEKFEPSDMIDFLDAIQALDNTIASGASADQINEVKEDLDGFYTSIKNDPLGDILEDRFDVIEQALLDSSSDVGDALINRVGDITAKNADKLAPQLAQALQLGNMIDALSGNVQDYAEEVAKNADLTLDQMLTEIQGSIANYSVFSTAADALNLQFDALADGAVEASNAVANLAGGVDNLQALQERYYQNYFSEEERRAKTIDSLTRQVAQFNLATDQAIDSKGGLRDYIESLDLMTESGQAAYAAALQMVDVYDQLEEANEAVASSFDDLLASAQSQVDSARSAAEKAYSQFDDQAYQQQLDLLTLLGRDQDALNLQRERELESIDESLRPFQERIWQLQDEQEALSDATQAGADYADALANANDALSGTLGSISQWVDQQNATGGSPGADLQESQAQFARQLVAAQNGDRDALNSITQYADQYLAAGQSYYGSGTGYQSIRDDVLAALEDMPDQVSAEEYVAKEITQALLEQTASITDDLSDVLRGDNPASIAGELAGYFDVLAGGIDGVLTRDQLALVMNGKATDRQLDAMIRALDLNGDDIVSGLESVIVSGMPTDATLANVLNAQLRANGSKALTERQVRSALSPIATDAEIQALIRATDANGDGLLDAQEVANARLGGLARGIAGSLDSMFSDLDETMDGRLTFDELRDGLDGIATDSEVRKLIRQVDLNGDGTISALEAVVIKGMPTDSQLANTLKNQLRANGDKALTASQVRSALSPIATDSQIKALIRATDSNGDGLLDAQEVANARLGGLAKGIGGALDPMFDQIDTSLDGLIDYDEFGKFFKGLASDARLKEIFQQLDTDGDGQISALEAVKQSTDQVGDNTGSLEQRSFEQLEKLTNLASEMTLQTDGFIDLNSNIVSLRESINALGVAQDEIARIEREQAEAEQAEKERIEQARRDARIESQISSLMAANEQRDTVNARVGETAADFADQLTGQQVDSINAFLADWVGSDSFLSEEEWDKAQAEIEQELSGVAAIYARNAGSYLRRESTTAKAAALIRELQGEDAGSQTIDIWGLLDAVDGSHANGLDYVPFDGYRAELHKGEFVATANEAPAVRAFLDGDLPPVVIPPPAAMGQFSGAIERLLQENNRLMQENTALLKRLDAHGAASVRVAQAGHQRQIEATERGNRSLDDLAAGARLESAR